jgi:iron-sulfur cluster repair protein YtfE (RIC family)
LAKQNGLGTVVDNVRGVAEKVVSGVMDAMISTELEIPGGAARSAAEPPDAIALLKKDHEKVRALFAQADALGDTAHAARLKLFKEIDAELTLHTTVEETIFYPAVKAKTKRNSDERDEVLEAYEEHAGAKELIAKLERLDARDETYKAKLQVLAEMIQHHVQEEESVLFPEARALLGPGELERLGAQIAAAKRKAQTAPSAAKPSVKGGPAKSARTHATRSKTGRRKQS